MSDRLRIGFFGGGIEAYTVLEAIVREADFEIDFVHPRFDDGPVATRFAKDHGVAVMPFGKIGAADAVEWVRERGIDLILSINCKQIFREPLLSVPPLGAINMHDGLLPRQRGGGGTFIGLVNHEPMGTSIHFIDGGIDTGDIILQEQVTLPSDATMADFQKRILEIAPTMVLTALRQIRHGCVWRRTQRDLSYYYVPRKAPWDELIDWSLPSDEILDRIRGRMPGPDNFYLFRDRIHYVIEAQREPRLLSFKNTPGQVIERHPGRGVLVKTGDTGLWLTAVRREDADGQHEPDHPLGAMLCLNVHKELHEMRQRLAALEARLTQSGDDAEK